MYIYESSVRLLALHSLPHSQPMESVIVVSWVKLSTLAAYDFSTRAALNSNILTCKIMLILFNLPVIRWDLQRDRDGESVTENSRLFMFAFCEPR